MRSKFNGFFLTVHLLIIKLTIIKSSTLKHAAYLVGILFIAGIALLNVNASNSETRNGSSELSLADITLSSQTAAACDGDQYRREVVAVCTRTELDHYETIIIIMDGEPVEIKIPIYVIYSDNLIDCESSTNEQCYPRPCDA